MKKLTGILWIICPSRKVRHIHLSLVFRHIGCITCSSCIEMGSYFLYRWLQEGWLQASSVMMIMPSKNKDFLALEKWNKYKNVVQFLSQAVIMINGLNL